MADLANILAAATVSGVLSSVLTVVALKVDVRWMKDALSDHETRLRKLEGRNHG